jgi:hypothetical protein
MMSKLLTSISYPQKLSTGKQNLWTTRTLRLSYPQLTSNLTSLLASSLAGEPLKRIARRRCVVLVGVLCVMGMTPAKGMTNTDYLKLYAHSRIIEYKEFQCFNQLITKESNWRVNAINGSHYGLGQMRNPKYRNLDGFRQIDWSIRYIKSRYKGSSCAAFKHWQSKGWH